MSVARKFDNGKPQIGLLPASAITAAARVMGKGREKYGPHNWRSGMDWSRLIDAALRHIFAFADGQDVDDGEGGSNELHLANAICCLAFLIEYYERGLGTDDRFKGKSVMDVVRETTIVPPPSWTTYSVMARGGTGEDVFLGAYASEAIAFDAIENLKKEWPSFTLYVKEENYGL